MSKKAEFIAPDSYPQMLSRSDAGRALKTLQSRDTAAKAKNALKSLIPPLQAAILHLIEEMEEAGTDSAKIFAHAHEIRGFAETAGLGVTGRIAEILCRYMDDVGRLGRKPDAALVALHVKAIVRAARAEEQEAGTGEAVAAELAALVARRLQEP